MIRRFHSPTKHAGNPLIAGRGGILSVVKDDDDGCFRMWYQKYWDQSMEPRRYTYALSYAESPDGLHWTLPRIGEHEFKHTRDNNVVLLGLARLRKEGFASLQSLPGFESSLPVTADGPATGALGGGVPRFTCGSGSATGVRDDG